MRALNLEGLLLLLQMRRSGLQTPTGKEQSGELNFHYHGKLVETAEAVEG